MGDLISRQDAIDLVEKWFLKIGLNGDICLDGLRSLSSAQQWIPCSERLPERENFVLVTNSIGEVTEAKYWHKEQIWVSGFFFKIMQVTAWMPLPQPWSEDE